MTVHRLFEVFGVEIEYMLVDDQTFDVRPVAPHVLRDGSGATVNTVEDGSITWSNELAAHVVELKTTDPAPALEPLPELFAASLERLRARLPEGVTILPGAAHPWMDPDQEFVRWVDDDAEIYAAFDRIFDCRGHGWSNLQSVHLNLPFEGDQEFGKLHEAIRLALPLIPALSAASPILDGRVQPSLDSRLEVYATNAARVPEMTGAVIPEPAATRAEYEARILEPLYAALAPLDPDGILRFEWANARGAIARFDRDAIEIRVIDAQECPRMDLAIAAAVTELVRGLVDAAGSDPYPTEPLAELYREVVRSGERASIADPRYLRRLGLEASALSAAEVWLRIFEARGCLRRDAPWALELSLLLEQGPLARRITASLPAVPTREDLRSLAARAARCLRQNAPLRA